jgi:cell fate regulator YaaT (PSP1 superfamily)
MSEYKSGNGCCGLSIKGCSRRTDKLNTYDWLADLPDNAQSCDIVEVQFKPPRKGYYLNSNNLDLVKGDIVAVESSPGHDIGTVTMTGRLVPLQIKKANLKTGTEFKRIYRKAKPVDLEKFEEAKAREHTTMIESRQIALDLGLKMKIGDVEYQGDGNKAIFYYIADERVDFRQLIKVLAERFHVRIEMKQIGARQEAGRIGGIGPCGRELCCSTWMTNFISVSTSAARFQDMSLNPQKLAGQCAKLKCCLNYEVDQYVESLKRLPSKEITLHTQDNEFYFFKADILNHKITYSTDKHILANESVITARRAFEIIKMNRDGKKPEALTEDGTPVETKSLDLLEQENINRFDKTKKKKKKRKDNSANDRKSSKEQNSNTPATQTQERPQRENYKNDKGNDRNRPRHNGGQNKGKNKPNNGEQK